MYDCPLPISKVRRKEFLLYPPPPPRHSAITFYRPGEGGSLHVEKTPWPSRRDLSSRRPSADQPTALDTAAVLPRTITAQFDFKIALDRLNYNRPTCTHLQYHIYHLCEDFLWVKKEKYVYIQVIYLNLHLRSSSHLGWSGVLSQDFVR